MFPATVPPHEAPPALLTIPQAAEVLGVKRSKVERLIKTGDLPHVTPADYFHGRRVPLDDVLELRHFGRVWDRP